jgi:predicted nucleic acid-binding protein
MNIFIDTNIIIDVLSERENFIEHSLQILKQCEIKMHNGYISVLSIANIVYICKKYVPKEKLYEAINKIMKILNIASLTEKDLLKALSMQISDYEDALQILAAIKSNAQYIITRNVNDFKNSPIPAIMPIDFLEL